MESIFFFFFFFFFFLIVCTYFCDLTILTHVCSGGNYLETSALINLRLYDLQEIDYSSVK